MKIALLVICGVVALTGCAHKRRAKLVPLPPVPQQADRSDAPVPPAPSGGPARSTAASAAPGGATRPEPSPVPRRGETETGLASWYGHPYHGRPAANGEIYNMEKLVAAHRTLPFDTLVRVVNLNNDRTVEVRIIDRGPFVDGRIIDLSHAAAQKIDLIGPGTVPVRVEVVRVPETVAQALFAVQVGAFRDRNNAERMRAAIAARYGSARLVVRQGNPTLWRVLAGSESTEDGAATLSNRIRQEYGEKNAFVVRLDF
ncbi:MAG TPA: septal ring lytic transglycosylase RlpA family protein [Bryobacteraceae bacterium]|nr:septal ring lytic transglycosylase RlpA family protein [Bryobacteraceae bacterium]